MKRVGLFCYFIVLAVLAHAKDAYLVDMHQSPNAKMHTIAFDSVRWTEGFWAERYDQTCTVTLHDLTLIWTRPTLGALHLRLSTI